ncbi:MAG: nucleoside deaminase [Erysipelotrichaceae bacterium]|nr:nucleoside deaminase [Erysipelotrichaceae bacterium]
MESVHQNYMREAIKQALNAEKMDEVPIGCVIVKDGKIISAGYNQRETLQNSTAHAEIMAIEEACRILGSWRLEDCDLYVTLEPCPMCAGAIIQSRIRSVYFGAFDPKGGCACSCTSLFDLPRFNHHPMHSGGILEDECAALLKDFFKKKRQTRRKENHK